MKAIELNDHVWEHMQKAVTAATFLWQRQWAERNAGNISINLTGLITGIPEELRGFRVVREQGIPKDAPGMIFFVTGNGVRLRELTDLERTCCVIRITDKADGYHILWGGGDAPDFRPTSEFNSHLRIHLDEERAGGDHRAVVHTHPTELIALTHHRKYGREERCLNRALWSIHPEIRIFVPRGVRLVPYALPGSKRLADLTAAALREGDIALWSMHGAVTSAADALQAFDMLDVANKGALILLKCLAAGFEPEGLTEEQLNKLADAFHV